MQICPCCKRRMPAPRNVDGGGKALREDLAKAASAVFACERALLWKNEDISFYVAVGEELQRMRAAQEDYALLWAIFRRNSKAPSYVHTLPVEVAA